MLHGTRNNYFKLTIKVNETHQNHTFCAKLEIYQFNPDESEINNEFESLKEDISSIFESNYFLINIKSDYLSSLKFLKYLQEYKMTILPYCFEPQMTGNTFSNSGTDNQPLAGEVSARIIVNIPNYK